MKAKPCTLIGNTSWGYCATPKKFYSIAKAKEEAKWMVNNGFWFAYRIIKS